MAGREAWVEGGSCGMGVILVRKENVEEMRYQYFSQDPDANRIYHTRRWELNIELEDTIEVPMEELAK